MRPDSEMLCQYTDQTLRASMTKLTIVAAYRRWQVAPVPQQCLKSSEAFWPAGHGKHVCRVTRSRERDQWSSRIKAE